MNTTTYQKSKFRWTSDVVEWPYFKRIVGCGIDCDADGSGYLLNSDGSKTFVSDHDAAMILLFARTLSAKKYKLSLIDNIRCWIAKKLLGTV